MTDRDSNQIVRPHSGRIIAGTSAALARRTGIPTTALRIGFVATSFFGGLGVIAYVLATVSIPSEDRTLTPFQDWIARFGATPSATAKAGWWILTFAGLATLAAVSFLQGPFVVLALIGIGAWLALGPQQQEVQHA